MSSARMKKRFADPQNNYGRHVTSASSWSKYHREAKSERPSSICCKYCDAEFTPLNPQVSYCTDNCRRKASWSSRNAWRKKVAKISAVNPAKVFDRANWRCESCGKKLSLAKRGTFGHDAPEVDHIMPLSKGGEHSYSNTRCLCRGCNIRKSAKPEGQLWFGLEVAHG
jgi:5-methylcytosine-specific restriction endonuclease McrA